MRKSLVMLMLTVCLSSMAQTEMLRDSLAAATVALAYHPDSIDLRLKKAAWNLQLSQWEYAVQEYNQVLKLETSNVAALFYRAYALERQHKYKFARHDYEKLLEIVPDNFEARLGLALLNEKDNHHSEAIDQLNVLCQYYPDRSEAFAARGGIELEGKQYELAEYDYSSALALEPTNVDYLLARAEARLRIGNIQKAQSDIDQLLSIGISPKIINELIKNTKHKKR